MLSESSLSSYNPNSFPKKKSKYEQGTIKIVHYLNFANNLPRKLLSGDQLSFFFFPFLSSASCFFAVFLGVATHLRGRKVGHNFF